MIPSCSPPRSTLGRSGSLCVALLAALWTGCLTAQGQDLSLLAETGHFSALREAMRQQGLTSGTQPLARSLAADLDAWQSHRDADATARAEAYAKAMKRVAEAAATDKLEDALVAVVEAQGSLEDRAKVLDEAMVGQLVSRAEAAAAAARGAGQWIEALAVYRLLALIYDPAIPYKSAIDTITHHARVLRIYTPALLQQQYDQRAHKRGDKEDSPPAVSNDETWEKRLEGIRLGILRDALREAAEKHCDVKGYAPLLTGAVDGLRLTIRTPGLDRTFPALQNPELVRQFASTLDEIHDAMAQQPVGLTHYYTMKVIDRILARNRATVNLPERVIVYELGEGAMRVLDEFSAIIWPYELDQFQRNTHGNFSGVGIQIARTNGRLTVVSPLPDTPAHRAGVKPGDVIAQVNGQDTSNWTLDWAVHEITGPEGSDVVLGIERKGQPDLIQIRLQRAIIKIESIAGWQRSPASGTGWDFYVDRAQRIGYVRMTQFIPQTPDDLDIALDQMRRDAGLSGLVLDLRFNPGGLLRKCVDVVDRFVRQGTIVSTVDASGAVTNPFVARAHMTQTEVPLVVLINQGSASASEIVAGALQDHHRATIVGQRSYGKGSVQDLFPLDGEAAYLKLTTQHYQLPLGRIIHRKQGATKWGVEPDVAVNVRDETVANAIELRRELDVLREPGAAPVEQPQDAAGPAHARDLLDKGLDPQLAAALIILKTRLLSDQTNLARLREAPAATP